MKGIQTGVAVAALLIGASAWSADTKLGAAFDDGAVTTKVKAALVGNPDTKARQINVDTSNGVVTLTGTVDSSTAKMSAESTARNVNGVSAVENHLMVSGDASSDTAAARTDGSLPGATSGLPTPGVTTPADRGSLPSDRTVIASAAPSGNTSLDSSAGSSSPIATRTSGSTTASGSTVSGGVDSQVMQALKSDQRTANLPIEVKSGKSGAVTLTGMVANAADRSAAAEVAREVSGVSKVDNKIMVKKGSTY
jgi:hyperosmotically inducible protein